MRIAVDIRCALERGGIRRYLVNLFRNLIDIDQDNEYIFYSNRSGKFLLKEVNVIGPNFRFVWEHISLPLKLSIDKPDLFFCPDWRVGYFLPVKYVITIHDLTPIICKDLLWDSLKSKYYYSFLILFKHAIKKARKIITVSEFSKKNLVELLGVSERKIKVIYNGIEEKFTVIKDKSSLEVVKKKFSLNKKFILWVGRIDRNKNILALIQAFSKAKLGKEFSLCIVGEKTGKYYSELVSLVKNLGLTSEVYFLGSVSDQDLVALYNLADLFVFPSISEGFGLPPLEAMACGTPVITSNTSSLPEIVNDAGILVNPYNTDELAEAIYTILSDEHLRRNLIVKGLERIKLFSWKKTAEETLKVYEEVYAERI